MRLDHLLSKGKSKGCISVRMSNREKKEEETSKKHLVPMRREETPVPIPNTTVKRPAAEDTMRETAWESRWVPDPLKKFRLNLSAIRAHDNVAGSGD